MLKALTSTSRVGFGAHLRRYVLPAAEPASPFLRFILGQNQRNLCTTRRPFSDSTAADSNSSSATLVQPDDCSTVTALPLSQRPIFPGFYMQVCVKDPELFAALTESRNRGAPYAGAFLVKDEEGTGGSDSQNNIYDLKGKDLFDRLRKVGTLAQNIYDLKGKDLFDRLRKVGTLSQITSIIGDQVVFIGHQRLRITEMVSEDPLTVKVDHLKEIPYHKDDDTVKATKSEVISTLKEAMKTSPLWRDHAETYMQHVDDFAYHRVADFGVAISGANKQQCQKVLEELDVHKRLKLALEVVKKEVEIGKVQV